MTKVGVLGRGAWGLALSELLQAQGHTVHIWSRSESLTGIAEGIDVLISALPMQAIRPVAAALQQVKFAPDVPLVTTTKGLEPNTILTPREVWQEFLPQQPLAVLSGPNLAEEILQGLPCATVIASSKLRVAQQVQQLLACERFRVYINGDVRGVELGGALKNVIAISAGVSDGLSLGLNARAALITRGLTEVMRVGVLMGGEIATFYGLSGLGDLQATCTSPTSRNYQVGWRLAQGESLGHILSQLTGTAEGINTAHVLVQLATQKQIELPIASQVCALLDGKTTPEAALMALMSRDLKEEVF